MNKKDIDINIGSGIGEKKCPDSCCYLSWVKSNPVCSKFKVYLGWITTYDKSKWDKNGIYRYGKCDE